MSWIRRAFVAGLVVFVCGSAAAIQPAYHVVVPAAARGAGTGGSVWQMDLYIAPIGGFPASVTLYWLARDTDNTFAQQATVTAPGNRTTVLEDVLQGAFGISSGGGAIYLVADAPIAVNSYIYNLKGGTRFGQGFEGIPVWGAVSSGMQVTVPGLRVDEDNRSNLFAVAGPAGAGYTVRLVDGSGVTVGTKTETLAPFAARYLALDGLVGGTPGDLSAVVDMDEGTAWVAGSRIDNASGDPFTAGAASMVVAPASLIDQLMGTYTGSWTNTTFGSSGGASVQLSRSDDTVTMVLDLDGTVFGGSDPPPETFVGTVTPAGVGYAGTSAVFGNVTLFSDTQGRIQGFGSGIPAAGVDWVVFSGTASPDTFVLAYTVVFTGGGYANGVVVTTR